MTDWTLDSFADLVRRTRAAQRKYYKHRHRGGRAEVHALLLEALELEGRVDEALREIAALRPLFDRPGG